MNIVGALLIVAGAVVVAGTARRLRWPVPLVLVLVGLALSAIPAFPGIELNPDLVLFVFLPPLLYSAALESSYLSIRANLRPIALLSVGLVLFTTVVVGLVAHALIPQLPLPAAFVLGAIVAPPDAVAATAVGRTLGLPRSILTILSGESLLNDATALTAYQVAVAAVVASQFSFDRAMGTFALATVGGVVLGGAVAWMVLRLLALFDDAVLENAVSLLTPFVAFALAEETHASGVLAVVVAGLVIGHQTPRTLSYVARLQSETIWRMIDFLLEAVVFFVIGLQLTTAVGNVAESGSRIELFRWSAVLLLVVMVSRFVWIYPAMYLPRLIPSIARREPPPTWQATTVIGWAGMRGVVSMAAAVALPRTTSSGEPFPERTLIIFLTFVVVIGTLVLQGFSLPWVIRKLNVVGREEETDNLAEAEAQHHATQAAVDRLEALLAAEPDIADDVVDRLRTRTQRRSSVAWERLGSTGSGEAPSATYTRLRREMLEAERQAFLRLRDEGRLDDEVLRRVHRELDLEEALLSRE